MKRIMILLLSLLCLSVGIKAEKKKGTFTVYQMNLWHGGTKVPQGYQAVLDVLTEMDADVVFLCEIKNLNGKPFIPQLLKDLAQRGKQYYGATQGGAIGLLTKYKPDSFTKCCVVPGHETRAMIKATVTICGQPITFYSCHLDYLHYECYMPRGYNGLTWKKMDAPITDEQAVLKANRESYRDESIAAFIKDAQAEIAKGHAVVLGGDFNEPSHLDWLADTKDLWDHHGAVIHWDCSVMLHQAGFRDSFREKFPHVVSHPGFTFPAGNKVAEAARLEKLAWAPEADERDRIDFVYYYPTHSSIRLKRSVLVGPSETVIRGKIEKNDSKDKFLVPKAVWPSDHKANLVTFKVRHHKE